MKRGIFLIIVLSALIGPVSAQKKPKKTKEEPFVPAVLVVGNNNAAVAAAIQSAASNVQTVLLLQAGGFDIVSPLGDLNSGIQASFLKSYKEGLVTQNKNEATDRESFNKQWANIILRQMTDTLKNLKVIRNVMWVKASRSGNNWRFELSDGTTIKPKVLVNPNDSKLNAELKISPPSANWQTVDYNNTIYRTSVAAGRSVKGTSANFFSLYQFFLADQENLIFINDQESMALGQAAGATAAYAAFFNTKTSLSNLKKIQGELLQYKLALLPFSDIENSDSTWRAIQQVGITGVIKGDLSTNGLKFLPAKLVSTEEIKQPIKDFFYKAQIWFDDYKNPKMTIASTLDMISYVGAKSLETITKEATKNWNTKYHFKSSFDLNRQISRREFAALLHDYMPPFNVNVDEKGKVIR